MSDDLLDGEVKVTGGEMTPTAMSILSHFKEVDALAKDYTVPCPEWCAELYDVQAQIDKLKEREAKLKEVVKKFKDRGSFVHGGYCLKVTERAGSKTLDKEALIARLTAELGEAEAQVYINESTKQGKPSVVISVEKLNSSGDLSGGVTGEGL